MLSPEPALVLIGLLILPALALGGVVGAQPIASEVADQNNLVQNGGFEEGEDLPAWWARHPPEDPANRHLRDASGAHSGEASGLLLSTGPHEPGKAGIQWNRYGIPVEGGSALLASFWMRTDGGPAVGAG